MSGGMGAQVVDLGGSMLPLSWEVAEQVGARSRCRGVPLRGVIPPDTATA